MQSPRILSNKCVFIKKSTNSDMLFSLFLDVCVKPITENQQNF